ncbi:hypothetical protein E2C01_059924 [Portunus trituberculatus]|uniref:Endonuclease/exonuclease/phosphatase family domain-containing protein 1 n=1 Tax=Portunus trituberculatus TaxID=210409 RepID=A0A5B7H9Z6_PORTR|nr:hypothetical protein [Portunus trituberculatus]
MQDCVSGEMLGCGKCKHFDTKERKSGETEEGNSWVPHHQHHHYSTTTEDDSHKTLDQYPKTYDPTTYRLSFDPLESSAIMDVLNNATMQHLATCGIGKGMASRLLKYRERIGGFQELSQLLEVDRLGIKGAEDVCKSLLQHCGSVGVSEETSSASSSLLQHDMADLETLIGQKRLVKPQLSKAILKVFEYSCFYWVDLMKSNLLCLIFKQNYIYIYINSLHTQFLQLMHSYGVVLYLEGYF